MPQLYGVHVESPSFHPQMRAWIGGFTCLRASASNPNTSHLLSAFWPACSLRPSPVNLNKGTLFAVDHLRVPHQTEMDCSCVPLPLNETKGKPEERRRPSGVLSEAWRKPSGVFALFLFEHTRFSSSPPSCAQRWQKKNTPRQACTIVPEPVSSKGIPLHNQTEEVFSRVFDVFGGRHREKISSGTMAQPCLFCFPNKKSLYSPCLGALPYSSHSVSVSSNSPLKGSQPSLCYTRVPGHVDQTPRNSSCHPRTISSDPAGFLVNPRK